MQNSKRARRVSKKNDGGSTIKKRGKVVQRFEKYTKPEIEVPHGKKDEQLEAGEDLDDDSDLDLDPLDPLTHIYPPNTGSLTEFLISNLAAPFNENIEDLLTDFFIKQEIDIKVRRHRRNKLGCYCTLGNQADSQRMVSMNGKLFLGKPLQIKVAPHPGSSSDRTRKRKKRAKNPDERLCLLCGKLGHIQYDCPVGGIKFKQCNKCHEYGHLAAKCTFSPGLDYNDEKVPWNITLPSEWRKK